MVGLLIEMSTPHSYSTSRHISHRFYHNTQRGRRQIVPELFSLCYSIGGLKHEKRSHLHKLRLIVLTEFRIDYFDFFFPANFAGWLYEEEFIKRMTMTVSYRLCLSNMG